MIWLLSTPALTTDWYFSDTASCGVNNGTSTSTPFCLNERGDARNRVWQNLFDGAGSEAACGDTINFCAGACDGTGAATWRVGNTGSPAAVWRPDLDCQGFSPVIFRVYCSGSNCETVTLNGDADSSGTYNAGDADSIVSVLDGEGPWRNYRWFGDPATTGQIHLIIEKIGSTGFLLKTDPGNYEWDHVEIRRIDFTMWNNDNLDIAWNVPPVCTSGVAIRMDGRAGNIKFTNNKVHHLCGYVFRNQTGGSSNESLLVENNEIYNMRSTNNDFGTRNHTWRNNYIHDVWVGPTFEENNQNVVIEDNLIACLGEYTNFEGSGRCDKGIEVNDGDNAPQPYNSKNITIRRNIIYATSTSFGQPGSMSIGISFTGNNHTESINGFIENNLVWGTTRNQSCTTTVGCCPTEYVNTSIGIASSTPVTVRNNSVYNTDCGIVISPEIGTTSTVNHVVQNNLIMRSTETASVLVRDGSNGSTIQNNNMNGTTAIDFMVGGSDVLCANIGSYGDGSNKCAAAKYVLCDSSTYCASINADMSLWDLHLPSDDTTVKDFGIAGVADDIDKQTRTGAVDIGADELVAGATAKAAISGKAAISEKATIQ